MPQPLEDQRTTVYKVDPEHPAKPPLPPLRTEEMMLNMGPQHPSTHGVLKVVLALEGERIVKATPVMGFLHRGVEKLAEDGTYHQFIPHTDRLDYVCAMYNNFADCRAVEKLRALKVPPVLRLLPAEAGGVRHLLEHQQDLALPHQGRGGDLGRGRLQLRLERADAAWVRRGLRPAQVRALRRVRRVRVECAGRQERR